MQLNENNNNCCSCNNNPYMVTSMTTENENGCTEETVLSTTTFSNNGCGSETVVNCDIRKDMMDKIRSLGFAINELALYLDTHPDDTKALCLHRKYAKELRDLTDKYQKVYGPLTINYPCNKWRWLEEPWPWERGNF
jgi:spore coat protein JB